MIRIHNTKDKNLKFNFSNIKQSTGYKPIGLWYDINNEWSEWCKSEQPNWIYPYNYKIYLNLSELIIIRNHKELISFSESYRSKIHKYPTFNDIINIDWKKVLMLYSGIEIALILEKLGLI